MDVSANELNGRLRKAKQEMRQCALVSSPPPFFIIWIYQRAKGLELRLFFFEVSEGSL